MGKVKDMLLKLEEEGVITWSSECDAYVLTDHQDPVPFDLAQYLYERHQREAAEALIESTEEATEEVMNDLTQENFWL